MLNTKKLCILDSRLLNFQPKKCKPCYWSISAVLAKCQQRKITNFLKIRIQKEKNVLQATKIPSRFDSASAKSGVIR